MFREEDLAAELPRRASSFASPDYSGFAVSALLVFFLTLIKNTRWIDTLQDGVFLITYVS